MSQAQIPESQTQTQIPKSQTQNTQTQNKREVRIEYKVDDFYIVRYIKALMRLAKNDKVPKSLIEEIARLSRCGLIIAVVRHSKRQELYSNLEKLYNYFIKQYRPSEIWNIVLANSDKLNRSIKYNIVNLFEYDGYSEYYKHKIRVYCGITAYGYNENKKLKRIVIEASCSSRKL